MKTTIENLTRDLAMRGYSKSTQSHYRFSAQRLMNRFGKRAADIDQTELRQYVHELFQEQMSRSSLKGQLCGLRFLYRKTLGLPERISFVSLPKTYSPLPDILSVKEVHALLSHIRHTGYQILAMVVYGCGLRISEALALEHRDVDGARGVIYVRHGKGDVAREVKLSNDLYLSLREYWSQVRPQGSYLFTWRTGRRLTAGSFRQALRKAAEAAGIKKAVRPHVLRHSFATHLLEQGIDSHVVSALLGHKSFQSTERYARVTRPIIRQTPSPLDLLPHRRR